MISPSSRIEPKRQVKAVRRLIEVNNSMVGNVRSITENCTLVVFSANRNPIAPYASTASEVTLVDRQTVILDIEMTI